MSRIKKKNFRLTIDEACIIRTGKWIYSKTKRLKIKIRKYHKLKDIIKLVEFTMDSLDHWVYRMVHNISPNDERCDTEEKVIEYAITKYGLRKYINKMEDDSWKENLIQKHKEMKERSLRERVLVKVPLEATEEKIESLALRLLGKQNS